MREKNHVTSIRGLLEQLSTSQLDQMLQTELEKENPDKASVQLLLGVLESREMDQAAEPPTPEEKAAWERYRKRLAELNAPSRPGSRRHWLLTAAASLVILLMGLFVILPTTAQAENAFQRFSRWTDNDLAFFEPGGSDSRFVEYRFETDNPGLQEVYEAVVELGVDVPVVPMWLPEGYELSKYEQRSTSRLSGIAAEFEYGNNKMVFKVDIYDKEVSHEYHKSEENYILLELYGISHSVAYNNNRWIVIWTRDEMIECFFTIDCPEDTLHKIIESIYVMEDT